MKIAGSYDRVVGIQYDLERSKRKNEDFWYTDNEFSFYIGEVKDQRYVLIPKGYVTDGASVPRIFWSIFPPWGVYGQAAIVHDYLCDFRKLTRNGDKGVYDMTQKEIDDIFYDAMKVAGTPLWKRVLIHRAVRLYHNLGF
jgi:hypothetical protein